MRSLADILFCARRNSIATVAAHCEFNRLTSVLTPTRRDDYTTMSESGETQPRSRALVTSAAESISDGGSHSRARSIDVAARKWSASVSFDERTLTTRCGHFRRAGQPIFTCRHTIMPSSTKPRRFSSHSRAANERFKRRRFAATGMPWLERARTG